jgi:hypothetical protein
METAGVEPAPPRCKRGALPPELHPQRVRGVEGEMLERGRTAARAISRRPAQLALDRHVSCSPSCSHAVPAVPHHELVTLTSQQHRRRLSALLQPLPVPLDGRDAQAARRTVAHADLVQRNPDRRVESDSTRRASFRESDECGRMESNHHSTRHRVYSAGSSPMLSVRLRGDRPDSNRYCEVHDLGCSPLHHGHHERGRPDSNRRPLA